MRLYVPAPVFFGGKLVRRGYHDVDDLPNTAAYLVTHGHAVVMPDEDESAGDTEPTTPPQPETDEDKTPAPVKRRNTKRG